MILVDVAATARGRRVLAGSAEGSAFLQRLVGIDPPAEPTPLFVDFRDIEVATTSFLRDGPLAFRELTRLRRSTIYPVFVNVAASVEDELQLFLQSRNDAVFTARTNEGPSVTKAQIIGTLEEKQLLTLLAVSQLGKADVSSLVRDVDPSVAPTAWNNRLAALVRKGLLMEFSQGRAKVFTTTIPLGDSDGSRLP